MITDEQETRLQELLSLINKWAAEKYRAGAEEHQGDMKDMSAKTLMLNVIDEQIDGLFYAIEALDKL